MFIRTLALQSLIALILVATLALFAGGSAPRAFACHGVDPKTGDLNYDGLTNSLDALAVDFFDAGLMQPPTKLWLAGADVNCDSSVNAVDASLILQDDAGLYQIRP